MLLGFLLVMGPASEGLAASAKALALRQDLEVNLLFTGRKSVIHINDIGIIAERIRHFTTGSLQDLDVAMAQFQ